MRIAKALKGRDRVLYDSESGEFSNGSVAVQKVYCALSGLDGSVASSTQGVALGWNPSPFQGLVPRPPFTGRRSVRGPAQEVVMPLLSDETA